MSDKTCDRCGQALPERKEHCVTVWVERIGGEKKPITSVPMTEAQAKKEWAELKAVGYEVSVHRAGKECS